MTVYILPLEPLPERYTQDWLTQFPNEFEKAGVPFQSGLGETLTDSIEQGRFLDTFGTIYWKNTQMAEVARLFRDGKVKDGDVFFDTDLWHPGLESIKYMADLADIDVKIVGILHAGLWDEWDFLSQTKVVDWGKDFELGWINISDKIFLGSEFHKNLILRYCANLEYDDWQNLGSRLIVTGLPFYGEELALSFNNKNSKSYDIVFPHRLHPEKRPEDFQTVIEPLDVVSIRTMDYFGQEHCDKEWYHSVLSRSQIAFSSAEQETFGYSMLEATALGCTPIVPNRLSYKEMYPDKYRYDTLDEAREMVRHYLREPKPCPEITYGYQNSIGKMIEEINAEDNS